MYKMKTIYETKTKTTPHNKKKPPRDPFKQPKPHTLNPNLSIDNATLDTFFHRIRTEMLNENTHQQNKQDNLTRKERIALRELIQNKHIVINKADKGSTIVVEDRDDYIRNAMTHLNDLTTYKSLATDITPTLKHEIECRLKALKTNRLIKETWFDFCKPPENPRTSRLYFLKKIHQNPMSTRPIVSSCNSITEKISQFVDKWLQPYVKQLPSHIKDSSDFINLIENTPLPTNILLASIDVSSLYTNIPHDEGIQSTLHYLKHSPGAYKHPENPIPEIITELMSIVLKNNVFEFNEKFYLQIQGTAMGTKMAPTYANLFMGKLEEKLKDKGKPHILLWKRFIDDIFIIWDGTEAEFHEYMTELNQIHDTIKFTHEILPSKLTFLDITLYKGSRFQENKILDIKIHIKPTNKQLYIHATSYHPPPTIVAISKGEAKRYLRTNSDPQNFDKMILKLTHKLKERGYKQNQITRHIKSVKFNQRKETLSKTKNHQNQERKLVFITQFNDDADRLKQIIRKHWKLIQRNETHSQTPL